MLPLKTRLRRLLRQPFSVLTIPVLASGIGLSAAALSPLWRATVVALPLHAPNRVVEIWETSGPRNWTDTPASPANLRDWATRSSSLTALAYHASARDRGDEGSELLVESAAGAELLRVLGVSTNLFGVLGVSPARGRVFTDADGQPGSAPVVVLSETLARHAFPGADPLGRSIRIEGIEHTVIGVMPTPFWFPHNRVRAWTPLRVPAADFLSRRQARIFRVVARLADGVTIDQARADLRRLAGDLAREYPRTKGDTSVDLTTLSDWLTGPRRGPYWLAATCGGLLLAIALVNASMLSWSAWQAREIERAVARALGASNGRLVGETMLESGLVTILSAGAAWPIAGLALGLAANAFGSGAAEALDLRAFAAAVFTTAAGLAIGAWMVASRSLRLTSEVLSRGLNSRAPSSPPQRWPTAAQVALSLVLIVMAVAALRGFRAVAAVPSGLGPASDDRVAVTITLRGIRFRDQSAVTRYFDDALAAVRRLPGVTAAGATALLPLNGTGWTSFIWMPDLPNVANTEVRQREITAGYVAASALPLLEGREFEEHDSADRPVALVNAAFAARYSPSRSPVGLRISNAPPDRPGAPLTIVGVVGDERVDPRETTRTPIVYRLHRATPEETMTIVARGSGGAVTLTQAIVRASAEVDKAAVVLHAGRLDRAIARAVRREEVIATLSGFAAGVAALIALAGLFAASQLDAERRRRDLAIRVALGAEPRDVAAVVLTRWLPSTAIGLAAGALLAGLLHRVLHDAVPGIDPGVRDGAYAIGAAAVAAACAIWPSARRAARSDPATLLRDR